MASGIRYFFSKIKWIIPWILKAVKEMFYVVVLAASSLWFGIPQAVDRIAGGIVTEAHNNNLPDDLDTILYWTACGVAVIEISLSWILLSYITVLLLGFFF